jgi:NADPH:quinone reductase-like Zn-dependent oxidoreductase
MRIMIPVGVVLKDPIETVGPAGLDAAEAVNLVLNYITAYQMLHRSAKVRPGQSAMIHGEAGFSRGANACSLQHSNA